MIEGVLLRLSEEQYDKLRRIANFRSLKESKHVSMQRVLEEFIDSTPDPSPASVGTVKAEAV